MDRTIHWSERKHCRSYFLDFKVERQSSMHSEAEHLLAIGPFLAGYYLFLAAMNGLAAYLCWDVWKRNGVALGCLVFALFCTILAPFAGSGSAIGAPAWFREGLVNRYLGDGIWGPVWYSALSTIGLLVLYWGRSFFVRPVVAWTMLNGGLLLMGLSMANMYFAEIVTKPDNVPIVAMVILLAFFTWLATYKSVINDERAKQGLPPTEKLDDEKILVWPDLVYSELICMVVVTAVLIIWGICLQAPLEEPASSVKTPNPSKAPWYFLGLQEMLVYFDPWYAGVVLPSVVVAGLMAIPYLDFNKKGNGYYTISERKFAYLTFQFGFLDLWVTLIILGTFLRGPNWNIFGLYEYWDTHKVLALNNVDLSQFFWERWLGQSLPRAASTDSDLTKALMILLREGPGILLLLGYFLFLPPLLATTSWFRPFFVKMGFIRFMVMINLLLLMATLPIKMLLRWIFNLKYIVSIPEYFLNF